MPFVKAGIVFKNLCTKYRLCVSDKWLQAGWDSVQGLTFKVRQRFRLAAIAQWVLLCCKSPLKQQKPKRKHHLLILLLLLAVHLLFWEAFQSHLAVAITVPALRHRPGHYSFPRDIQGGNAYWICALSCLTHCKYQYGILVIHKRVRGIQLWAERIGVYYDVGVPFMCFFLYSSFFWTSKSTIDFLYPGN